jgi:hypothetical protein
MTQDIIQKFREKWKTLVFNIPNTDINVVDEKSHEWVELILISLLSAVSQAKEEGRKIGYDEAVFEVYPTDVSKWASFGKKHGYWDYFLEEGRKQGVEECKKELREKIEKLSGTIHKPVGGFSNIEWFTKDDIFNLIK